MTIWTFDDAAEAVEAMDAVLGGHLRLPLLKARKLNPLNARDFLVIVGRIRRQLEAASSDLEYEATRDALATLDVDWVNLTDRQRDAVIAASRVALGKVVPRILPRTQEVFDYHAPKLSKDTKAATVHKFKLDIRATLDRRDEDTARYLSQSQTFYVRDQYKVVHAGMSAQAQAIVAEGLADGLGSAEISAQLAKAMPTQHISKSYWDVVAQAFSNRARTYTQVHALDRAAVQAWMFEAVLDEVTTDQCRFMHGTVFPVQGTVDQIAAVMDATQPEAVKTLQPWLQVGKDAGGARGIYYKDDTGARQFIATIQSTGVGVSDKIGQYSQSSSEAAAMQAVGSWMPPLHGRCRSTIVPK